LKFICFIIKEDERARQIDLLDDATKGVELNCRAAGDNDEARDDDVVCKMEADSDGAGRTGTGRTTQRREDENSLEAAMRDTDMIAINEIKGKKEVLEISQRVGTG
jgi:hypothetical protein